MNAADMIRADLRAEFGEFANNLIIKPGRSGWVPAARAKARAQCRKAKVEAQHAAERLQRLALVVPREGSYNMVYSWRTDTGIARLEDRKALALALKVAGLERGDFIRVRLDGSGRGTWGWPCTGYVEYPPGTFVAE